MLVLVIVLVVLILLSALFSGSEVALLSVSHVKIRTFLKEGKFGAHPLNRLRAKPQRMLVTVLIGNNAANFSAAALVAIIIQNLFGSEWVSIGVGILTLVILVFSEIIPKSFAASHAPTVALLVARPIEILAVILSPLVILLNYISKVINKLLKIDVHPILTRTDIHTVIELGLENRIIAPQAGKIINRSLKINDTVALTIMTPAAKVFSLNCQSKVSEILGKLENVHFASIPIYTDDPYNIVGVITAREILLSQKEKKDCTLLEIAQKPIFVDSLTKLYPLLQFFQKNKSKILFLRNTEGKFVGITTLEDILEEIVGDY